LKRAKQSSSQQFLQREKLQAQRFSIFRLESFA